MIHTTKILDAEDGSGDGILQLPPEFVLQEDWREGDTIEFKLDGEILVLENVSKLIRENIPI